MMYHYQRKILAEAAKYGGTNISKSDQITRMIGEEPVLTGGEAAPTLFGWGKHQFEAKFRELLTRMGFERGIIHIKTEGQEMKMYFANAAKARDFVVAFNGLARRKSMGSVASVATQFNKIKSPTGTNAIVSLDLTMVRGESLDLDGTDLYEWFSEETETITEGYERVILNYLDDAGFKKGDAWFENGILYVAQKNLIARAKTTLKNKRDIYKLPEIKLDPDMKEETVSEGGVKAALADFMEGLPKEMVADIRKIIKLSVVNTTEAMKRKNKIEAIRKKYKIAPDFMGTPTWKVIIDYFNTFHGESVEVAEAFRFRQQDWERMRSKYKQGTPVNIVLKNGKTVSGTLLRMDKYDQGFATKGHLLHVKTSSGRVEVDDVDVKSIQWNNDSKTKMSEETEIEEGVRMMAGAEKMVKDDAIGGSSMVSSLRAAKKSLEGKPTGSVLVVSKEKSPESMSIKVYSPSDFASLTKGLTKKPEAKVGSKGSWSGGEVTVVAIKEEINEATTKMLPVDKIFTIRGSKFIIRRSHPGYLEIFSAKFPKSYGKVDSLERSVVFQAIMKGERETGSYLRSLLNKEEVEVTESIDVQTAKRRFANFQYKKSSKTVSGDSTEFVLHGVKENELRSIFGAPKSSGGMKQWSFEHDRPLDHQFTIEFDGSDAYINSSRKGNPTVRDHIKGVFGMMGLRVTTESVEVIAEPVTESRTHKDEFRWGAWLKPYQYLLEDSTEKETIAEGYERKILMYLEDGGFKKGDAWFENGILYVASKNLIAKAKTILKKHTDIYKLPNIQTESVEESVEVNEYYRRSGFRSSSYSGDPRWITAKYAGVDAKGRAFKKGEEVLYYPNGKKIYSGPEAEKMWREFQSAKGDEMGMPYAS